MLSQVAHFIDSKRVLPGLIDTIMCGCGGNVYAVAVTNKRIVVQNDKRYVCRWRMSELVYTPPSPLPRTV